MLFFSTYLKLVKVNFERFVSSTFVFVCAPIHNFIIRSTKGTYMALSSVKYLCAARWSEPGIESMMGCEWAAD